MLHSLNRADHAALPYANDAAGATTATRGIHAAADAPAATTTTTRRVHATTVSATTTATTTGFNGSTNGIQIE